MWTFLGTSGSENLKNIKVGGGLFLGANIVAVGFQSCISADAFGIENISDTDLLIHKNVGIWVDEIKISFIFNQGIKAFGIDMTYS